MKKEKIEQETYADGARAWISFLLICFFNRHILPLFGRERVSNWKHRLAANPVMTVFSIRRQPYILIRISLSRWTRSLSRFSLTCSSWRVIYSNSTVVLIACDTAPLKPTKTYSDVVDFLYLSWKQNQNNFILCINNFMATSMDHLKPIFNWPRREMFVSQLWKAWAAANVITLNNTQ